ncbi:hemicentin-1 [Plakobranchus ocellatus]|uniref:Hemicentin-1 n=1 Tax=Plakobranchus ocellatus TaxID=259542 RepID=A0AAV4DQA5_9GAST|nr:hemicentin-1 [Plakobranchus ocellatus]
MIGMMTLKMKMEMTLKMTDEDDGDDDNNNNEYYHVTWRRLPGTAPLTIGPKSWTHDLRVQAEHVPNSSQWNLVIERVTLADAGQYECQVSRRRSALRHLVTLVVKGIEISGDNLVRIGAKLSLTCNASLVDVAAERVSWWKDGKPLVLDKENRFKVHTRVSSTGFTSGIISSKLDLRDARASDSGVYLCRSTERAQMAGVKVEVQGESTLKRADQVKEYSESSQLQTSQQKLLENGVVPGINRSSSCFFLCYIILFTSLHMLYRC